MNTKPSNAAGDWVYTRDAAPVTGDFSDRRIVLVAPWDGRIAWLPNAERSRCQRMQPCDGRTYIAIGPDVVDESLARVHERYGIPLADLVAFRERLRAGG